MRARAGFDEVWLSSRARRARRLAREIHRDQRDRYGNPVTDHVARVARAVPPSAQVVAFVHDVCERSENPPSEVAHLLDLDEDERYALLLLIKLPGESLLEHTRRVVGAPHGAARELALVVAGADIDDHARQRDRPDARYATARAILSGATGDGMSSGALHGAPAGLDARPSGAP